MRWLLLKHQAGMLSESRQLFNLNIYCKSNNSELVVVILVIGFQGIKSIFKWKNQPLDYFTSFVILYLIFVLPV